MLARYSVLMCENCLTVRTADIMLRIIALLSAGTDKAKKSAEAYIKKLENGELSIIGDSSFMESSINLQSPPSNNGSYLTQFIELQQYLKGSFFNELGLRANYNMKREAIGQGESTLDADSILPLCDNMLQCRKEDIAKVNELFSTDIEVDFSSAWLENRIESSINIVSQLNEAGLCGQDVLVGSSGDRMDQLGSSSDGSDNSNNSNNSNNSDSTLEEEMEDNDDKDKFTVNGSGETGTEDGRDGNSSERSGDEDSEVGEPAEGGDPREGERGEEDSEERSGEVSEEEINEVRDELNSDKLSIVEAVNEVILDNLSQLVAEVRKVGDEDEISDD